MILLFRLLACAALSGESPREADLSPGASTQAVSPPAVSPPSPISPADPAAPWPDWLLETRTGVLADRGDGRLLPAGAVLAPVAEAEDHYVDLLSGSTVMVPPAYVKWSADWTAAHGTLAGEIPDACAEAGAAPDCQLPTIAAHADGRLLLRLPTGAAVIARGKLMSSTEATSPSPEPDLYLSPGDAVTLDCPERPSVGDRRAEGPAKATAARGEEVEIEVDGKRVWLPGNCASGGVARVANLHSPPRAITGPRILHFWATWCAPCVAELDAYAGFAARAGQGAVAVSEDYRQDSAHMFLSRRGYTFESWYDADGKLLASLGGAEGLPVTMVVDRAGKVQRTWVGPTDWSDPALLTDAGGAP